MPTPNVLGGARHGEALAGRALNDRWMERVARGGLLSRAVNYLVLGLLVAVLVAGRGSPELDRKGTVQALAGAPFGRALLLVLCVGFVAYIAWQLLRAAVHRRDQDDKANAGRRLLGLGTAVLYLTLLVTTINVLVGSPSSSPDVQQESWTARLFTSGWGRLAVGAVGAVLVVSGLIFAGDALTRRFEKTLDMGRMGRRMRSAASVLGIGGQVARGLVFVIIGGFVLAAALSNDAAKSKGLDASLKALAAEPFGVALLAVVSLGFFAFGVYSLIDARYRKDFTR